MWFILCLQITPILLSVLTIPLFPEELNVHNSNLTQLTQLDTEYGELTSIEINGLKRFREIIDEELVLKNEYERSDDYLIRWLRDCDMNVQSAAAMLRKAMEWRKENEIDNILNKTFLPIKSQPCFLSGFDKKGGPILIYKVISIDLRKLIASGHMENLLHHSDQCVEQYIQSSIRGGPKSKDIRMTAGITLVDAQGYSIKQHGCIGCVGLYRQLAAHSNNFYPQSSKLVIIVNAPSFARPIIEMVKPFISPYFKKTIRVFGSDKDEYTTYLLSHIPKEELLEEFGGTKLRDAN